MKYTDVERQTLDLMDRTDFKAVSKNEIISMVSRLGSLRPEVAKEVLAKYPEFISLTKTALPEYYTELTKIIDSDSESLKKVYDIADKELDSFSDDRQAYYEFAESVRADLSKCLDNPDLTQEERKEIIEREMEILKVVDKKDSEIRADEQKVIDMADRKDSEKRQFNWNIVKAASSVLLVSLGAAFTVLGGNIDFKLPKINYPQSPTPRN